MNVAGRTYPAVRFTIEKERVLLFCRAIGAAPEAGVPPTFAAVYALGATVPQLFGDEEAGIDLGRLLHGEQEFTWGRHPEVGETVIAQARVTQDQERRGMRFVTLETSCTDEAGNSVCTSRMLSVIRP